MTLICVQPTILYYGWQIEVMLENFKELELEKKATIQCLFAYNKTEKDWERNLDIIKKVEKRYNGLASFFYYEDTRVYPVSYISSIRPNILKQHYKKYSDLINERVFYHDCDIVFTKFPEFLFSTPQNDSWFVSDTTSYIGYEYIISKGEDVLSAMCDIVGINPSWIKSKQSQSGGAQYILHGVDWRFWDKVEKDSERLFKEITALNLKKCNEDKTHHPIQIWCADMWALLWNAWLRGFHTEVTKELSFCWATDPISMWEEENIFHNAGVTINNSKTHFYKANFREILPYAYDGSNFDKTKASYKYWECVQKIGDKSCLYE